MSAARRLGLAARLMVTSVLASAAVYFFFLPGLRVAGDLRDRTLHEPGIPSVARRLFTNLAPHVERWARDRVASGKAGGVALHDVPSTEWPLFTAAFFLMSTENLEDEWETARGPSAPAHPDERRPSELARGAIEAARDLLVDPIHHSWVRTHWGPDYLHKDDLFFRALLIAGLASHERLTHDGTSVPMLRDQVETLSRAIDDSPLGLVEDYPGECYPIDVLAAVGIIRRADAVLGTDHSAFVARSLRAFEGPMADELGLVRYRVDVSSGAQIQPSRGVGNSWVSAFAPDLWPDRAGAMYARYEAAFWQRRGWATGFREFARGTADTEWMTEVDAGPVLDGLGTAASAFGVAAARKNGRFDHAYALEAELVAASWPLPDGTLLVPRLLSSATDAPFLGEAGLLYMLTVPRAASVPVVTGGETPRLVWLCLLVYFGVSAASFAALASTLRAVRRAYAVTRARDALRSDAQGADGVNPRGASSKTSGASATPLTA